VQWTAFADQPIDYRRDIELIRAKRWPIVLSREQFRAVTGEEIGGESFRYYCNNMVAYKLCGVPVVMEITWDWEAAPGRGDVYEATFEGTRSRIDVRQDVRPEVYVKPAADGVADAVERKVSELQDRWPGLAMERLRDEVHLVIPEKFRVGHEAHFAQVTNQFAQYLAAPESMPVWETPGMLAKYYVSTKGTEMGVTQ
jgi:hypothetical protein